MSTDAEVCDIVSRLPAIVYRRVLHPDGSISYPFVSTAGHHLAERLLSLGGSTCAELPVEQFIHPDDQVRWTAAVHHSARTLTRLEIEARAIDGCWIRTIAEVQKEADGCIVWNGVFLDVTALKHLEACCQTMLRELHHRVKNNLAGVEALIQWERGRVTDADARERLNIVAQRVHTMAKVHERFYRAESNARVNMAEFLSDLVASLSDLNPRVRVDLKHVDPVMCVLSQAVPLALIANELITNAIKYAYPAGDGVVGIRLVQQTDASAVLTVEDDGIGKSTAEGHSPSGGLILAESLANQIGGTVQISFQPGTIVTVSLPLDTV